jgi:hypothetical protein
MSNPQPLRKETWVNYAEDRGLNERNKQAPLTQRIDSVIRQHVCLSLQQNRSGVQPVVRPENGQPRLLVALHERPVDGGGAPMTWQEAGMVDDPAVLVAV